MIYQIMEMREEVEFFPRRRRSKTVELSSSVIRLLKYVLGTLLGLMPTALASLFKNFPVLIYDEKKIDMVIDDNNICMQ